MRIKLTEIISTMDQYNGIGEYMDKYKDGEQLDIQTDIPNIPKTARVNEDMQKLITNLLKENKNTQLPKENNPTTPLRRYTGQILKFDDFVNEHRVRIPQHDEEQYTSQFYPEDDMLYKEDEEEE